MNVIPLELARDQHLVGGKAINLAHLLAAGFPVPGGFVVSTGAFRAATDGHLGPALRAEVATAYTAIGEPVVAVRSSATAEDLAGASMAGQYETILDVQGADAVCAAIERCWASLRTPRVAAYLERQRIDPTQVAMAVVVQRLVPSAVAGVLFTVDPRSGIRDEMVIECAWGLGESVVGALVQPDNLVVGRDDGAVRRAVIADKAVAIRPGIHGLQPVAEELRRIPCLSAAQVEDLRQLGLRVERAFHGPQDLEWAIADERLYLLQSRAITTLDALPERVAADEAAALAAARAAGAGPWVRHNLSETLPHPTPLTWSIMARFMSGAGGFGTLYREMGFDPAPAGVLRLIAGRLYQDLSRAPDLFWRGYPYAYDLARLRANPDAAQDPPDLPNGDPSALRAAQRRLQAVGARLRASAEDFDRRFEDTDISAFHAWVAEEKAIDLAALPAEDLASCWRRREALVLDGFAPRSLLPSALCAHLQARLRALLAVWCWDDDPAALAERLSADGQPSSTIRSTAGLRQVARGELATDAWLAEYGHRAPGEFDLAIARWHERPAELTAFAAPLLGAEDPLAHQAQRAAAGAELAEAISRRMDRTARKELHQVLDGLHRLLRYREDGKHELMRGYGLLRAVALEIGRRLGIGAGVFLLERDEMLQALATGYAPLALINRRDARRQAEAKLALPAIIDLPELATLGVPLLHETAGDLAAFPIASGRGRGPTRIVLTPETAGDLGTGYVLVCPSTDPSWTPLFVKAAALVLERGGSLSHGAVVARELGIPAVVLADACSRLPADRDVTVDGTHGRIGLAETTPLAEVPGLPSHVAKPPLPPPPGPAEARSARWRNALLAGWGIYLALAFWPGTWSLLHVYQPSIGLLDRALWPLRQTLGGAWTVALLATAMALIGVVAQRLLTDNRRLLVARDRAAALRRTALQLPSGDPRRAAWLAAAAPIPWRLLGAAMVPVGWFLGPMVMLVFWLTDRIEVQPLTAGSTVQLIAEIDGEATTQFTVITRNASSRNATTGAAGDLPTIDTEITPATQSPAPIRATLQELERTWSAPTDSAGQPWDVQAAARTARTSTLVDLRTFLAEPMPPQELVWRVHLPNTGVTWSIEVLDSEGHPAASVPLTGGGDSPPPQTTLIERMGLPTRLMHLVHPDTGPVRRVLVDAPLPPAPGPFLRPFHVLGWEWDAGWLLLYICAYMGSLLLAKRLLRVA